MLKKVLKLIYFAQKFAQTEVLKLEIGKILRILENFSILLNKLKEFSEKLANLSWCRLHKNVQKKPAYWFRTHM